MKCAALLMLALSATLLPAHAAREHLLAGPATSTDAVVASDLVQLFRQGRGPKLDTLASAGSVENVRRLAADTGMRLAIVQEDVVDSIAAQASAGNATAATWADSLRVVLPLFDEEVHFVVRQDSALLSISDIRNRKINVGALGSGSAFTATRTYAAMFGTELPAANASFLPDDEALKHLLTDASIDVVVIVSGQPAPLLTALKPEALQSLRLLSLDPTAPESLLLTTAYAESVIWKRSYPGWLKDDVASISVRSMLLTRNFQKPALRQELVGMALALCKGSADLRAHGHPKWAEFRMTQPRAPNSLAYYPPTHDVLSACVTSPAVRDAAH